MPRPSPYEGHADFYLLDLWERRFRHTDSPAAHLCDDCGTVVIRGRFGG